MKENQSVFTHVLRTVSPYRKNIFHLYLLNDKMKCQNKIKKIKKSVHNLKAPYADVHLYSQQPGDKVRGWGCSCHQDCRLAPSQGERMDIYYDLSSQYLLAGWQIHYML